MLQRLLRLARPAVLEVLTAATFLLVFPATSSASGNVLVVDANGGGAYTTIQSAVDAAWYGDVVLVRGGSYPGFAITNKNLTVVADAGAYVTVQGGTLVQNLAAWRTVVLSGLHIQGTSALSGAGLQLSANTGGRVRVDGCEIVASTGPGVVVGASADVLFSNCTLRGGATWNGFSCAYAGRPGLEIGGSTVALYSCSIRGADGTDGQCYCSGGLADGGPGGSGAIVSMSTVFVSRSTIRGGDGGDVQLNDFWIYGISGNGGHGIQANSSTVRFLDSTTTPGSAGEIRVPGCGGAYADAGFSGSPRIGGGLYIDIAGSGRGLSSSSLVHAGTLDSITVRGQPGDQVGLFLSPTTQTSYEPAWHGALLVPTQAAPARTALMMLGTVPANGVLDFPFAVPPLAPGAASRTTYLQALCLDAQGERWLSDAHCMTTLP